jgi:hypothetical protein
LKKWISRFALTVLAIILVASYLPGDVVRAATWYQYNGSDIGFHVTFPGVYPKYIGGQTLSSMNATTIYGFGLKIDFDYGTGNLTGNYYLRIRQANGNPGSLLAEVNMGSAGNIIKDDIHWAAANFSSPLVVSGIIRLLLEVDDLYDGKQITIQGDTGGSAPGYASEYYSSQWWNQTGSDTDYEYWYDSGAPQELIVSTGTYSTSSSWTYAELNGSIDSLGPSGNVTSWGFLYGTSTGNYTTNITETGSRGVGSFSELTDNLTPETWYYYKAWADNNVDGTAAGIENAFFYTADKPQVSTGSAVYDTATSANMTLLIETIGAGNLDYVGIIYGTISNNYTGNVTVSGNWSSPQFVKVPVPGLALGQTYYYRATGHNPAGESQGQEAIYTHGAGMLLPNMITEFATTNSTATTTMYQGIVDDVGSANVTIVGIEWGLSSGNYTSNVTAVVNIGAPDGTIANWYHYYLQMTGLTVGQTYYVNAIGYNEFGWSHGVEREYVHGLPPTVVTEQPLIVPGQPLLAVGRIVSTGGDDTVGPVGFSVNISTPWGPIMDVMIENALHGEGLFTLPFSGLLTVGDNVTYYAWAVNLYGRGVGDSVTFTVTENLLSWQGPGVRTVSKTNITKNSFVATGEVTSKGLHRIIKRGFEISRDKIFIDGDTGISDPAEYDLGLGLWSETISGGFNPGETLYFRAYALDELVNIGAGDWMEVKILTGSSTDPGGPPGDNGDQFSIGLSTLLNAWNMDNTMGHFAFIGLVMLFILVLVGLFIIFNKEKLVQIVIGVAGGVIEAVIFAGALFSGFLGTMAIVVVLVVFGSVVVIFSGVILTRARA